MLLTKFIDCVHTHTHAGSVAGIYGSGVAGLKDGGKGECQFNSPQGILCHQGALYVADTNNHAIRKVSPGTANSSRVNLVQLRELILDCVHVN